MELLDVAEVEASESVAPCGLILLGVGKHPGVLQSLGCRKSPIGWADELADQVLGLVVNVIPLFSIKIELSLGDTCKNLVVVITKERGISTEKDVEHAAGRPHIARAVIVSSEHLR